jgi:hypothetical protein
MMKNNTTACTKIYSGSPTLLRFSSTSILTGTLSVLHLGKMRLLTDPLVGLNVNHALGGNSW